MVTGTRRTKAPLRNSPALTHAEEAATATATALGSAPGALTGTTQVPLAVDLGCALKDGAITVSP